MHSCYRGCLNFERYIVLDTLNTTTPLVTKLLLAWLTTSYEWHRTSDEQRAALGLTEPQGVGYGIGLGFAIFIMQGTPIMLSFLEGDAYELH